MNSAIDVVVDYFPLRSPIPRIDETMIMTPMIMTPMTAAAQMDQLIRTDAPAKCRLSTMSPVLLPVGNNRPRNAPPSPQANKHRLRFENAITDTTPTTGRK